VLYLVGCDGARSFVRNALVGTEFEGLTEPHTFLLGDVKIDGGNLDDRSLYIWWHEGGTVALFPFEEGYWRVFTMRDSGDADQPTTTLEELQQKVDRHGPPALRLRDPTWMSVFHINERLAPRYRKGRCFLAGDAAHIHSPAGGQGIQHSLQHDPPAAIGSDGADVPDVIDHLIRDERRVGDWQHRLGVAEARVIVAAARHEIVGRHRIGLGGIERRIADLDR
jgi:hypothetical protein